MLLLHPKERREKRTREGREEGEGELFSLSQPAPLRPTRRPSHSTTPQRSQPASQPAGAGVREERNADARQKCGAGKSEASAATDERTAERKERVSGGEGEGGGGGGPNERTHLLSPPLLAVLCSASQTSSVTPPLLLYFCSIFRVLAEWGPGKGSDGRASGRTRERTSGLGRRECEEQDPQRVPNSQQPPRRTSGQKQVAPTDGDFYRKQIVLGPDRESLKDPLDQPGQA